MLTFTAQVATADTVDVVLYPVAVTGTTAPKASAGVTFSAFQSATINSEGDIAFVAGLAGPTVLPGVNDTALYLRSFLGVTTPLVRANDSIGPGTGSVFGSFGPPRLDPSQARAAFPAELREQDTTTSAGGSIWLGDTQFLRIVAQGFNYLPGAPADNRTFLQLGTPLPATGEFKETSVLFDSSIDVPGLGTPEDGLFLSESGDVAHAVLGDGDGPFHAISQPQYNATGTIAFFAANTDTAPNGAVWQGAGAQFQAIVAVGDTAPGTPAGTTFAQFTSLAQNDEGDLAFAALLSAPGASAPLSSVWLWKGGALHLVASEGDPAPGGGVFGKIGAPALTDAGQVAFTATLAGAGSGLWRGPAGNLALLVAEGGAAPIFQGAGLAGAFGSFADGAFAMNGRGDISFSNVLTRSAVSHASIWFADRQGLMSELAEAGARIPVQFESPTVQAAALNFYGGPGAVAGQGPCINNYGYILFGVQCVDGRSMLLEASVTRYPNAMSEVAEDLSPTSATLIGFVVHDFQSGTAHFDYGTTTDYGQRTPDVPFGDPLNTYLPVRAPITGLLPSTEYHMRLVIAGGMQGDDVAFTTLDTLHQPVPVRGSGPVTFDLLQVLGLSGSGVTVTGLPYTFYGKSSLAGGDMVTFRPGRLLPTDATIGFTLSDGRAGEVYLTDTVQRFAGAYQLLLRPAPGASPTGLLQVTISPGGAMSGTITIGTTRHPFAATVNADDTFHKTISRGKTFPPLVVDGSLVLSSIGRKVITASLNDGSGSSSGTGVALHFKPTFGSASFVSAEFGLIFDRIAGMPPIPGGQAYASATISQSGVLTIRGKLPDGTPLVAQAAAHGDGEFTFYTPILARPKGMLAGDFTEIDNQAGLVLAGGLDLIRNDGTPAGYDAHLGGSAMAYSDIPLLVNNSVLSGSNGPKSYLFSIHSPDGAVWSATVTVESNDVVKTTPSDGLSITIHRATSTVTGTHLEPDGHGRAFSGVIDQSNASATGYYSDPAGPAQFQMQPAP